MDVCPIIREEVYSTLQYCIEKRDLQTVDNLQNEHNVRLLDVVLQVFNDGDKSAKTKGIEFAEKYLIKSFKYTKITEVDEFYEEVFKLSLGSVVTADSNTCFALIKVIQIITKYYAPATKGDHLSILKQFIFHTNPLISKEFLEILCDIGKLKILTISSDEEAKKIKIPSAKELSTNFKAICEFLDDPTFNDFTAEEIGDNFTKIMVISSDLTLFHFKLYGTFMNQYQQKASKSKKKKQVKNTLPEIFMHVLRNSCQSLNAFLKINNVKPKISEEELEYFKERASLMEIEILETLSAILTTYNVDDPIIEPALKLFEVLDFNGQQTPDEDLSQSVLDSIFKLYDRQSEAEVSSTNIKK